MLGIGGPCLTIDKRVGAGSFALDNVFWLEIIAAIAALVTFFLWVFLGFFSRLISSDRSGWNALENLSLLFRSGTFVLYIVCFVLLLLLLLFAFYFLLFAFFFCIGAPETGNMSR
jgi:hypothetical protein